MVGAAGVATAPEASVKAVAVTSVAAAVEATAPEASVKAAAVETADYPGVAASERRAMRVTAKAVAAMEGGLVGATAVAVVKMVALVDAPAEVHLVGYTVKVALKGEEMATLVAVKEDRA